MGPPWEKLEIPSTAEGKTHLGLTESQVCVLRSSLHCSFALGLRDLSELGKS